jgi:dynamin-like GTPase MGM1, mitochondrial
MSGRIASHRLTPLLRRGLLARHVNIVGNRTGGLLRVDNAAVRGRAWPIGASSIHNNVPAVRNISFARILPRLAIKLARIPAMFGGAMIAGVAYIQYQAMRM